MFKIPGIIPISISPFFWVLAIIIGWLNTSTFTGTLIWTCIIVFSVLIHEFGHALTARSFGQKTQIELNGFGGLTTRSGPVPLSLWKEFIIVLNGPLAGFLLSFLAWMLQRKLILSHPESMVTYVAIVTFYINFVWTIINLIPVQPLDGGKLLGILLESIFGLKGKKAALFISFSIAGIVGLLCFSFHEFLIGSLFLMFAFEGFRAWKSSLLLTSHDDNLILLHLFKEAEKDLSLGDRQAALEKFERVKEMTKAGVLYLASTENIAHLLVENGNTEEAYQMLKSLGQKASASGTILWHRLAFQRQDWKETITLGNRLYRDHPQYETALINAICCCHLGDDKSAIGWLHSAVKDGLPNLKEILKLKDFDNIRNEPAFQELLT